MCSHLYFVTSLSHVLYSGPEQTNPRPSCMYFIAKNCDAAISYKWNFCSSVLLISTQVYAHAVSSQAEPEPRRGVACSRFGTDASVFVVIYVTIKFDVV